MHAIFIYIYVHTHKHRHYSHNRHRETVSIVIGSIQQFQCYGVIYIPKTTYIIESIKTSQSFQICIHINQYRWKVIFNRLHEYEVQPNCKICTACSIAGTHTVLQ